MPSAICWWITNVGCHRKWRQAEEKSLGWLERVRREEFGCWPPRKPPTAVQQLPIWQITLSYTSYDLYPRADYVQRFGEPSGEDELQWNGESHVKKVATEWNVPCLGLQIVACWGHRLPGCSLFRKKVATNIQAATGNPTLLPSQAWRGEGILSTIAIEKLAAKRARWWIGCFPVVKFCKFGKFCHGCAGGQLKFDIILSCNQPSKEV